MARTGIGQLTRTGARESAQWSTMFAVMAGDYLLTRAHALASTLGPRIGAAMGRAVAGAYLSLMQESRGDVDPTAVEPRRTVAAIEHVAIFHELPCRLAGIAAGVPDAAVEILAEYGRHLGVALAMTKEVRGGTGKLAEMHHALTAGGACLARLPSGASRHSLEMVTSLVERLRAGIRPAGVCSGAEGEIVVFTKRRSISLPVHFRRRGDQDFARMPIAMGIRSNRQHDRSPEEIVFDCVNRLLENEPDSDRSREMNDDVGAGDHRSEERRICRRTFNELEFRFVPQMRDVFE